LRALGHRWVVYEAALILENGLTPGLEELIAVVSDPASQLHRVMKRDQLDSEAVADRIQAQTTNERRRREASYILENDADLPALYAQVDALVERLTRTYGAPLSDRGEDSV